jgi:subtilisin family serine protease
MIHPSIYLCVFNIDFGIQPDIMAPGVAILAATIPKTEPGSAPIGKKPPLFAIRSGTSMACPHVTGAASLIKSVHPGWTPSMIKSALMTTGTFQRKEIYQNLNRIMGRGQCINLIFYFLFFIFII